MENNRIIVISREYGSGGSRIGQMLAERLGISYYDKRFVNEEVKNSGLSTDFVEKEEQKFISSLLFSLATGGYRHANNKDMSDQLYIAESNAIRQVAQQGPCVIVGRCADYILEKDYPVFSVFVHADLAWRAQRCVQEFGHDYKRVESQIREKDRTRARHYEYYTGRVWGDRKNYHLSVNAGKFGLEKSVELICRSVEMTE